MTASRGNIAGMVALVLWSSTSLLIALCAAFPAVFLTALTSLIGAVIFIARWVWRKEPLKEHFKFPYQIVLMAVAGIGGYRILLFASMYYAEPVEASLINYLWPILLVVFSGFLPDEKLKWYHLCGGFLGFLGILFIFSNGLDLFVNFSLGHLLALGAAVTWAVFSVASRATKKYSSSIIPIAMLYSAIILFVFSYFTEDWHSISINTTDIIYMVILGATSAVGYFLWDVGMKYGNIQILGVLSYFVVVLSTFLLIIFGMAAPSYSVFMALIFILSGSLLASKDKILKALKVIDS